MKEPSDGGIWCQETCTECILRLIPAFSTFSSLSVTSAEAFLSLLRHQGEIWGRVVGKGVMGGGWVGFHQEDTGCRLFTVTNYLRYCDSL